MSRASKMLEIALTKDVDGEMVTKELDQDTRENPWEHVYEWKYGHKHLSSESEYSSKSREMPSCSTSESDYVIPYIDDKLDQGFPQSPNSNKIYEELTAPQSPNSNKIYEELTAVDPFLNYGDETAQADENIPDNTANNQNHSQQSLENSNDDCVNSTSKALNVQKAIGRIGGLDKGMPVEGSKRKVRMWDKRDHCMYCDNDVTNFSRHLIRKHKEEPSVRMILDMPKGDKSRKIMLSSLRKEGNFSLIEEKQIIRPVQRLNLAKADEEQPVSDFMPCPFCKGVYRKSSLTKHVKKCPQNQNEKNSKLNVQSLGQNLMAFNASKSQFINKTRIKNEVYSRMNADRIALVGKSDPIISQYGDDYLKKHKRPHIRNAVSNKVRELGRLLIQLQDIYKISTMIDALDTQHYDKVVHAVHIISGYDPKTKVFQAPSLAMHMRTNLLYTCLAAKTLLLKRDPVLHVSNHEEVLKKVKSFRNLVEERWKFDMGSLAQKDLEEKHGEKPQNIPITSDVIKFQKHVLEFCEKSYKDLQDDPKNATAYKNLSEATLVYTMVHNRKRPGDAQYTRLESYTQITTENNQEEFVANMTAAEKLLNSQYKRITTLGKGSKRVAILFPQKLQNYVDLLIKTRSNFVNAANPYLFGDPNTLEWLNGPYLMAKFAKSSKARHPETLTSSRLRKQIATVLQVLNLSPVEREQLASFMGHTEKTHNEYYRLPQSLYQTAKVSKLLQVMEQGGVGGFEGKSLDEIDFELYKDSLNSDDDSSIDDPEPIANCVESTTRKQRKRKEKSSDEDFEPQQNQNVEKRKTRKRQDNEISNQEDSSDAEFIPKRNSKSGMGKKLKNSPTLGRGSWNDEQKTQMKKFFKVHLKKKISPKKAECLKLMSQHPDLFDEKTWVQIKDSKEKELLELKFPIRVRRVMDRIESSFAEPSFCENCLQFGHKTTECQNPKAKKSRDAGANKLNRRAAYFEWVLREKGNTVEIAPLMAELKLAYNNHFLDGVENFEEYKKKFCHSLAVIHNIVDTKVHPEQVGKKLKNVNIFGKPLDSFALLLVKALDYSPDPDKPALEYED